MTEPEEDCSRRCGYVSSGRDLLDHERHEHRRCPDCGREPVMDDAAVSHKADCPRLQPGYTYPDALVDDDEDENEYDEPEWDSEDSNAYVAAEEAREDGQ